MSEHDTAAEATQRDAADAFRVLRNSGRLCLVSLGHGRSAEGARKICFPHSRALILCVLFACFSCDLEKFSRTYVSSVAL